ncbi:MAG: hypothetical protein WDZ41_01645 [Candidatus Babeliales bacterium]
MKKILIPLIFIISRTCFSMETNKRISRKVSIRTIPIQIPKENISTSQSWPSIEERKKIFESKIKKLTNEKQPQKPTSRPKSSSYSALPPVKREKSECFGDDAFNVNQKLQRRKSRKKIEEENPFDTLRLKEKHKQASKRTSLIDSELKKAEEYINQLRHSKEETETEANQVMGILAYKELIKKNKP